MTVAASQTWPAGLKRHSGAQVVYLDLNHWIGLAKAAAGHRDGKRYARALEACREARFNGTTLFPLSSVHYMEICKIADTHRRADLASVMEDLSGFWTLLGRARVLDLERESALRVLNGEREPDSVNVVGWGVMHAFGRNGRLRMSAPPEVLACVRAELGAEKVLALEMQAQRMFERYVIAGPATSKEEEQLTARGWNPHGARAVAEERARSEREQADRFDAEPRWRKGRTRDVICARELCVEVEALNNALEGRHRLAPEMIGDRSGMEAMIDMMPSLLTTIEVKTALHRNATTRWDSNSIFDVDAMSVAVPYSDLVVCDREIHSMLTRRHLDAHMNTLVLHSPDELAAHLAR